MSGSGAGVRTMYAVAEYSSGGSQVGGVDGSVCEPMTERDLPPPNTKRWVMSRKAEVVAGVRCGLISLDEACRRYTLSVEEFLSWQRLIDSYGLRGLRATRLQEYRVGADGKSGVDMDG